MVHSVLEDDRITTNPGYLYPLLSVVARTGGRPRGGR